MIINDTTGRLVVEDSIDSVKVTIHRHRKWGWFLPSFFVIVINGFCFMPISGLVLVGLSQQYLPKMMQSVVLVLLLGLFLYILYTKFLETLEYIFDKETIEIDDQSITIERSGFLGFRNRKVYWAEYVKGMTTSFSLTDRLNFLNRLPFASSNIGAFMIWHGHGIVPFSNFGKGVSQAEAQKAMDAIYRRFPKYRYSGIP